MARARRSWAVSSSIVGNVDHSERVEGVGRWKEAAMVGWFGSWESDLGGEW